MRFGSKLRRILTVDCTTTDILEKDTFYERIHAVQERLLKADIVILVSDQNVKGVSDRILLGHPLILASNFHCTSESGPEGQLHFS